MRCGRLGAVGVGGVRRGSLVLTFGLCFNLGHTSPKSPWWLGGLALASNLQNRGLYWRRVGTITWYYNFCRRQFRFELARRQVTKTPAELASRS